MFRNYINWTKVYRLNHQNGLFRVYVSSHTNDKYFGGVLHYSRTGNWMDGDTIEVDMKLEQFMDNTEEGVYQQCIDWVDQNLSGRYDVELEETKGI